MSEHEKAALPAATDKTAHSETLSEISVSQESQKCNNKFGGGSDAAPTYTAIDGEQLMSMDIPPIEYVVEELLTPFLFILAGDPKAGKSWMMLQFCLSIIHSKPIWGFETNGKSVFYMCLEDSYRRIRRRIEQLDEVATNKLHFQNTSPLLRDGLEEVIEQHTVEHPDTSLVIIDTFQMVRGSIKEGSGYANDYADVRLLKLLADKLGITILLVHHLRKQGDDNPFHMISGTNGLTGAADGILVLAREEDNPNLHLLSVTGRDIEQKALTLEFDHSSCQWEMLACKSGPGICGVKVPDVIFAVCDYIKNSGSFEGSASELLAEMNENATPVNTLTKALNAHKDILHSNYILYEFRRTNSKKIITLAYCA